MLILRPIGTDVGIYYRRGQDPGRWLGRGAEALDLAGIPTSTTLGRILAGRHPEHGGRLGHTHPHRRAGWDLIFAAPKSVSLLAAVAPMLDSQSATLAHRRAVATTMTWLATEASWARRDGRRVAADGVVAAAFEHGNSAAGDPHLHTHVLLANLLQAPDGRWSALDSSALWQDRRMVGSIYDLALRHELGVSGLALSWEIDAHGLADIVGIPREAIDAVSYRHAQVRADLSPGPTASGARPSSRPSPRRTAYAASRTRPNPPDADWRARLAQVGFGPAQVFALLGLTRIPAPGATSLDEPLAEALESHLAARATSWSRSDAIQALAATSQTGAAPSSTMRLVDELVERSPATSAGRWTSVAARAVDQAVLEGAAVRPLWRSAVPERIVADVLDDRSHLSAESCAAVRDLVLGADPVTVLAGTPGRDRLLDQAAVLDAARAAWQAGGVSVGLDAPAADVARWRALAGLGVTEVHGAPAVIVVDRADRRSSPELLGVLQRAATEGTRVVLVAGGTLPARHQPRSSALDTLARQGRSPDHPLPPPAPGRTPRWEPSRPWSTDRPPTIVESGHMVVCATTADALQAIMARWQTLPPGRRPVLVGLGPPETEALNRSARAALRAAGAIGADQVTIGGRPFAAGDRVLARRPGPAAAGSLGTVTGITQSPRAVTVRWDTPPATAPGGGAPVTIDAWTAQRLTHGYAVTSGQAARVPGSLLVLGDPRDVPRLGPRDASGYVVAPTEPRRVEPLDRLSRLAEELHDHPPTEPRRRGAVAGHPPGLPEGSSLAALAERRDHLELELRRSLPRDVTDPRRPPVRAAAHRKPEMTVWIQTNRAALEEWRDLGRRLDQRAELVAHAAVVDLDAPAQRTAGAEPLEDAARPAWRRAVGQVARHAERWPSPSADLGSTGPPRSRQSPSVSERLSQRRRDDALQDLERARSLARGRRLGRDLGLGR